MALGEFGSSARRTLKTAIDCVGQALHSGARVRLCLVPAEAGSGIVFHRVDTGYRVPAKYDYVIGSRLCTSICPPGVAEARVGTIEHLMAALAGHEIDDLVIEVDGPELPIMDGSAVSFSFLIQSAGVVEHGGRRRAIEVLRPVRVESGESFAELRPHGEGAFAATGLDLSLAIDFPCGAIGRQALSLSLTPESFATLAPARTFTLASEIESLREAGLAKGGSLANAVVVDGSRVLNPEGLRCEDEFVRHKMLDVVGDLALAGAPLIGRFIGDRTGHALNNKLLRALFGDVRNYRMTSSPFAGSPLHLSAVAAPF